MLKKIQKIREIDVLNLVFKFYTKKNKISKPEVASNFIFTFHFPEVYDVIEPSIFKFLLQSLQEWDFSPMLNFMVFECL